VLFPQYDSGTETEHYAFCVGYSPDVSTNKIFIGGGSNDHNGATELHLMTQVDATTRNAVDRLVIDSAGLATFSNGIAFSGQTDATGTGITSGATTLDHYEEGTFTPTLGGSTTDPTVTYASQEGVYTRVGNLVTVKFQVGTSANTGGAGLIKIAGLPFTQNSSSDYRTTCAVASYNYDMIANGYQLMVQGISNTTSFYLLESRDNGTWVNADWARATSAALYWTGTVQYWV
jgi:hypothetical protein